jgi:hypothetical protein
VPGIGGNKKVKRGIKVKRDIHTVLDRIEKALPKENDAIPSRLLNGLKQLRWKLRFCPPEIEEQAWGELAAILYDDAPYTDFTGNSSDWVAAISRIMRGVE